MRATRRWVQRRCATTGGPPTRPAGSWLATAPPPEDASALDVKRDPTASWLAENADADVFAVDTAAPREEDAPRTPHWVTRYDMSRRQRQRQQQSDAGTAPRLATATTGEEEEDWLKETMLVKDKARMFEEAMSESKLKSTRWGLESKDLEERYPNNPGMRLRVKVEEREMQRQAKAFDILKEQREQWNLHPIHFVTRSDSRLNEIGEDIVPYSQEKLEKEKAKWHIDDALRRQELEEEYRKLGWKDAAIYQLFYDWYALLPEAKRFFMQPYYQSMRPYRESKNQQAKLADMLRERDLVVFEERNSHRVIRKAMNEGKMPFVKLPPPRLIWDVLPKDVIIDDYICGQSSVTLERRQGAILLRKWLPNGQKISCEVIGADYLNEIPQPTPMHVDWDQIEQNGGFLIHNIMNNAVDHHNNFTIVGRVEEAVAHLNNYTPDPTVEFHPRDYRFYPYLWVTNPDKYAGEDFGFNDAERTYLSTATPSPNARRVADDADGASDTPAVEDYQNSASRHARRPPATSRPKGRAGRRRRRAEDDVLDYYGSSR